MVLLQRDSDAPRQSNRVLQLRQSTKSVAIFRRNAITLVCVLLLLSLGCDQSKMFPAFSAPTETVDSVTVPVPQADSRGFPDDGPTATPNPTTLPISQTGGQDTGRDEFTDDGGVPLTSLSSKVQQVIPAVVRVNTDTGSGSGVIVQTQGTAGYIVTNHHVTEAATSIQVTVGDGSAYQAEILGEDAVRDLAVLRICCGGFPPARFGDVVGLEPATEVLVIGYPRGMSGPATITRGIVSAMRFNTTLQSQVIQTDAATNPGNSGGPIVSLGGEVLGIMTFKYMDSEGLGFAIPGNVVLQQLPSLWASDQVPPPVPSLVPITDPSADDELEARIQEAIQELMPTPAPTPIPAPQPPQASGPAPTLVTPPTPAPPTTPTPTPHPCDFVVIESLEEFQSAYNRFMITDPYTNSVNTDFREVLAGLFPEIVAAYILEFIDDPLRYASFQDYLEKTGYQASGRDIRSDLQNLRHNGEWRFSRPRPVGCNWARAIVFHNDELMTLLAVEIAKSGVSPFLREAVTRITMRDIYAFRDRNPETSLIYFVLEMDDSGN